jgi:hypothetical protein
MLLLGASEEVAGRDCIQAWITTALKHKRKGNSARAFCLLFKMHASSSYHINKYTEEQCMDLCKALCARMNWLYEMWSAQGCDLNFKFHSVDLLGFVEDPALVLLERSVSKSLRERVVLIRALVPKPLLP